MNIYLNIHIYINQPTRLAQHVLCRCDQHFGGYVLGYWWIHMVSEGKLRFKRFREISSAAICWQTGDTLSDLCLHAFSIPKRKLDQTCCQFRKESRKEHRKGCWIGTGKLPCSIAGENCKVMDDAVLVGDRRARLAAWPWSTRGTSFMGLFKEEQVICGLTMTAATEHGRVEEAPKHLPGIPYAI